MFSVDSAFFLAAMDQLKSRVSPMYQYPISGKPIDGTQRGNELVLLLGLMSMMHPADHTGGFSA